MSKKNFLLTPIFIILSVISSFASLSVSTTAGKMGAGTGDTISYRIDYANTGAVDDTNVVIWDTIPVETGAVGSTFISSTSGTVSGGVLTYNLPLLTAGTAGSITFTVQVDSTINTTTSNLRNVAYITADSEPVVASMPVFTTIMFSGESSDYVTYAAWEDRANKQMGFIHVYTLLDNTDLHLYDAPTELTSMNNLVLTQTGVSSNQVVDYPNVNPSFNGTTGDNAMSNGIVTTLPTSPSMDQATSSRYFRLQANKRILWTFDAIIDDEWSDYFIYLMSTDFKFSGSTFFTHVYCDRNPWNGSSHQNDKAYGDAVAVHNINNFDIAAYVYSTVDNGAHWAFKVSNTVKAETGTTGGVWFYGGTTMAEEGDVKIILRGLDASGNDIGDAKGIAWKGDIFSGKLSFTQQCAHCNTSETAPQDRDPDHDNNNAFFIDPDGNKTSRAGSDVMYGTICDAWNPSTGRGELNITNVGATPSVVGIYLYLSDASGYRDPVNSNVVPFGNSGAWQQWGIDQTINPGQTLALQRGSTTEYGSFAKLVLRSGGPIQAIGGSNILAAHYGQADYLEAVDTNSAVGQDFYFGNGSYSSGNFWMSNAGGIFEALCPISGTTVQVVSGTLGNISGNWELGISPSTGTTIGDNQAIRFYSINTGQTYHIHASKPIYLMVQNLKGREKTFQGVAVGVEYFFPQASLTKTASTSSASTGDTYTYTFTFNNAGSGSAKNVRIVDTIPPEVAFVSQMPPAGWTFTQSGSLIDWDAGANLVAPNSSVTAQLVVKVTTAGTGVIHNKAITYLNDNTGVAQAPKQSQDVNVNLLNLPVFDVTKTVNPTSSYHDQTVQYTITYKNSGLADATGVTIWDTIPPGLSWVSGGTYDASSNVVSWAIGNCAINNSGNVSFMAMIASNASAGQHITNTANVKCAERPTIFTNPTPTDLAIIGPTLTLSKSVNPSPASANNNITYTLTLQNSASAPATGINLWDTIPAGMVYNSTSPAGIYDAVNNVISWSGLSVPANGSVQVQIVSVLALNSIGGNTISNTAYSTCQQISGTQSGSVNLPIVGPNLKLSKTVNPTAQGPGQNVVYTITAQNTVSAPSIGTALWDSIPVGLSYVSSVPPGTYSPLVDPAYTGVISWAGINVPGNGSTSVNFTAMLDSTLKGGQHILNTAYSQSPQSVGNQTSTAVDLSVNGPILTLVKSVNPTKAEVDSVVTYNINYKNTGTSPATGIVIWDTIPDKLVYLACTGGLSCNITADNVVYWNIPGPLAVNASGDVGFTASIIDTAKDHDKVDNSVLASAIELFGTDKSNTAELEVTTPELKVESVTNYPNPASGPTTLVYNLTTRADVIIKVFTISGELVRTVKDIKGVKGVNKTLWDATNDTGLKVASGIYIYRIEANNGEKKVFVFNKLAEMR